MPGIPGWGKGAKWYVLLFRYGRNEKWFVSGAGVMDRRKAKEREAEYKQAGADTRIYELQVLGEVEKEADPDAG